MIIVQYCSNCKIEHTRQGQRYCVDCHSAYMREWRKTHPLNEDEKYKDNCRSAANAYKKRGHLIQKPCRICWDPDSQMHHPDYDRPLEVEWLCRPCHLELHRIERSKAIQEMIAVVRRALA